MARIVDINSNLIDAAKAEKVKLKAKIAQLNKENKLPTFNCHTHIFNFDHVHDQFVKGMIAVRFLFLAFALILAVLVLVLLIINLLLGKWPLHILRINPVVYYSLLALIMFLLVLFLVIRKFFITIRISWLKNHHLFRSITRRLNNLLPGRYDILDRMANFVKHSYDTKSNKPKKQEQIFNELTSYYSSRTKFIVLTMDLDYMIDGKTNDPGNFETQLSEIKELKDKTDSSGNYIYRNKLFPFIHADPRRLADSPGYFKTLETYIRKKTFQGIKIYPALGYFPFDKRLKPVYDLALKYNLPITTHCSIGPVYYRGNLKSLRKEPYYHAGYNNGKGAFLHPFTGKVLQGKTPKEFTPHFTHPLNYYCLMAKPDKLAEYWNRGIEDEAAHCKAGDLKDYRNLKFCLGHFGGSDEWVKYLKEAWLPSETMSIDQIFNQWDHTVYGKDAEGMQTHSWHTLIFDMLTLTETGNKDRLYFPNLYSDISYNLSDEKILPLLKIRLETNETFFKKVLFGTDFYMVSMEGSEREITMNLRSFIGETHFKQIAKLNPLEFLFTHLTKTGDLLK